LNGTALTRHHGISINKLRISKRIWSPLLSNNLFGFIVFSSFFTLTLLRAPHPHYLLWELIFWLLPRNNAGGPRWSNNKIV
jgi:hypothetical protein